MNIKMLKNGKISKTSLKNINFDKIDFYNTNDIGIGSVGVLRLCVFSGSFKKPKFSHYEYYLVDVINENYKQKTDYCSYVSTKHRFTLKVRQVLNGDEKRVNDTFTKRGKNLYGNYYEIKKASMESLIEKHQRKMFLMNDFC